jgi:D-galactose 1-dehydrogenase
VGKIKLGIVGIGKIARDQHLPVLAQSDDFELVAAASRNSAVDGLRTYPSMEAMLAAEPAIEAVSLCTPPDPREADARIALARGVHVLLEKPPATTLSAARDLAARANRAVLNTSWHSRHAPGVAVAKDWLSKRRLISCEIIWKEDIRRWHPGQNWILDVGGMGVFDPGINALSILTALVPEPIVLTRATLETPCNHQAPLSADLTMQTSAGAKIHAVFDFQQSGEQIWYIRFDTDAGALTLSDGGARLAVDDIAQELPSDPHHEYLGVYRHFAECIRSARNDCDLQPLELVADAFMFGRRSALPAFDL